MRIAAISDIHGNLPALEAVLADLSQLGVDQLVNLGDILSGPLFPAETAARLMPLGLPTIQGNHERQLLTQPREAQGLSDRQALELLDETHLAWLRALPSTLRLTEDVLLVHGTEADDLTLFLQTVTEAGLRNASEDELLARAGQTSARVILCGHTHLPGQARLADGRLIVNAGSVGLQAYEAHLPFPHVVETGSPRASYAILEKQGGTWSAELRRVDYDFERAAVRAEARGRPEWAKALRTGRV